MEVRRMITKAHHKDSGDVEGLSVVAVGLRNAQSQIFDVGTKLIELLERLAKSERLEKRK